ncbi:GLOBULAR STAGE putative-RELATED [Salix purpurea]|uniref:GLOBULAR STAGE putative-RELATED n=1 Tax=Salix purpurea TaxID=77065 RepID=A0A9Q0VRB6_SALPP|nr:GLOBULAR STAGE putative-RELATED [Salix purpurea]
MEKSEGSIVERRKELMVSLSGDAQPTLRTAHFIKPSITSSIDENTPKHPSHYNSSLPSKFEPKKWPLKITFHGWRYPQVKWKEWVDKMAALHETTWRKVGIYQAVMSSLYQIRRDDDLLLGLAEKWCSETNTFIFPWSEATITLEDILVAGYSVLGSPVFSPLETEELKEAEQKLREIRGQLMRSKAKRVNQHSWIKYLMENSSEVEHEAFLSLWLSRNVRLALDSEGSFQWRPYATAVESLCYKIYGDEEKWVLVDFDEELKSFTRCMRACELVGIGCVEQYSPHRVAMQFGMDQDLPGPVKRRNETQELSWKHFNKQIKNAILYIPSRHHKPDVTLRYLEWWKQSEFWGKDGSGNPKSSEIFAPSFKGKKLDHYPLYPPGFPPKCQHVEVLDSDEEDGLTLKELFAHKKLNIADRKSSQATTHSLLSSSAENNVVTNVYAEMKLKENSFQKEPRNGRESTAMENTSKNKLDSPSPVSHGAGFLEDDERGSRSCFDIHTDGLELKARIDKLRKEIDGLKAAKFGQKKGVLPWHSLICEEAVMIKEKNLVGFVHFLFHRTLKTGINKQQDFLGIPCFIVCRKLRTEEN